MPPEGDGSVPERPAGPGIIVLPVLGALFGSNAALLGQMVMLAWNAVFYPGAPLPQKLYEQQDGLFTIGIGFIVLTAVSLRFGKRDTKSAETLVTTTTTTIVGAVFSVLKYLHDTVLQPPAGTSVSQSDVNAALSLLVYPFIALLVFVMPALIAPRPDGTYRPLFSQLGRAFCAGVVGLIAGLLVQAVVKSITGQQAHFFVIAPAAIGGIMPIWCIVMFDPLLRRDIWGKLPSGRGWLWIVAYLVLMVLLVWFYAALNAGDALWIDLLPFLPSLIAAAIAGTMGWFEGSAGWRPLWAVAVAAGLGAVVGLILLTVTTVPAGTAVIFVLSHLAASGAAVAAMWLALSLWPDRAPAVGAAVA